MFLLEDSRLSSKRHKRQRDSSASLEDDIEDRRSAKRTKHSQGSSASWHRTPDWWDSLSKVHLTAGALEEFDRRILRQSKPGHLTSKANIGVAPGPVTQSIKKFARLGGPDLSHVRGLAVKPEQHATMSRSSSSRKRPSTSGGSGVTGRSKSSYDANFKQNMVDSGIYPHDEVSQAANTADIRNYMSRSRASLSPSKFGDKEFKEFKHDCRMAADEPTAIAHVMTAVAGDGGRAHYQARNRLFNNLDKMSDKLPYPQPDQYDGALPSQVDEQVRHDLAKHIVPSNNTSLPAAPNFFMEGKGASGRPDVSTLQVCHAGAVGARAMHSLQNYGSAESQYDGKAYSYSSTYQNGLLRMYGHHPTAPKAHGGSPEYHMTQLRTVDVTDDVDTFRAGAAAFRNLRDLGKTHRDGFIEHANEVARRAPPGPISVTSTTRRTSLSMLQEERSDTSVDELARSTSNRPRQYTSGVSGPAAATPTATPHYSPVQTSRASPYDVQYSGRPHGPARR